MDINKVNITRLLAYYKNKNKNKEEAIDIIKKMSDEELVQFWYDLSYEFEEYHTKWKDTKKEMVKSYSMMFLGGALTAMSFFPGPIFKGVAGAAAFTLGFTSAISGLRYVRGDKFAKYFYEFKLEKLCCVLEDVKGEIDVRFKDEEKLNQAREPKKIPELDDEKINAFEDVELD